MVAYFSNHQDNSWYFIRYGTLLQCQKPSTVGFKNGIESCVMASSIESVAIIELFL